MAFFLARSRKASNENGLDGPSEGVCGTEGAAALCLSNPGASSPRARPAVNERRSGAGKTISGDGSKQTIEEGDHVEIRASRTRSIFSPQCSEKSDWGFFGRMCCDPGKQDLMTMNPHLRSFDIARSLPGSVPPRLRIKMAPQPVDIGIPFAWLGRLAIALLAMSRPRFAPALVRVRRAPKV